MMLRRESRWSLDSAASMYPATRLLARINLRARVDALEDRLRVSGDGGYQGDALWRDYVATLDVLLRLEVLPAEANGTATLTTKEMAQRLGVSVKTLLARKAKGHIRPSVAHGKAFRWAPGDALR